VAAFVVERVDVVDEAFDVCVGMSREVKLLLLRFLCQRQPLTKNTAQKAELTLKAPSQAFSRTVECIASSVLCTFCERVPSAYTISKSVSLSASRSLHSGQTHDA